MDTNTVQVVTEFGNKLDSYVSVLATKAGMAAEHFYPVLIRQQVIEGWSSIILALIGLVGCVLAFSLLSKSLTKDPGDMTPKRIFSAICGAIFGIILFLITFINIGGLATSVAKINNPEFYAVRYLVQMVK